MNVWKKLTANSIIQKLAQHRFLFEELVKRDFKRKYKRTVLGMFWSVLFPLMTLMVLKIVFGTFFGRSIPNYTIYLFCGTLLFSYFRETTNTGMVALLNNAPIFSKINVPKYIFLLSASVSSLINFLLSLSVFFLFCIFDNISFSWKMLLLIYPIAGLTVFNIGVAMFVSCLYVFFRDMRYLYDIVLMLLMYMSAIFYSTDAFPPVYQKLFLLNPVYVYISYFRSIVINSAIPDWQISVLVIVYPFIALLFGCLLYKNLNRKFLYYV